MNDFSWELVKKLALTNPLFWLFLIIAFISWAFYRQIVGFMGEVWTKEALSKLNKKEYKVLNNIMIDVDNKTYQIDHIVISKYGIFVIETKQYNGYITGSEYDKNWCLKAGNKKIYINNPMYQNYGHVVALSKKLNLDMDKFIPIVCIPSTAKVNVKSRIPVARNTNIVNIIKNYQEEIISKPALFYEEIKKANITDYKTKKEHIVRTRAIINAKKSNMVGKCPLCGNDLILKNGSRGEFYGCKSYPKCKYTQSK